MRFIPAEKKRKIYASGASGANRYQGSEETGSRQEEMKMKYSGIAQSGDIATAMQKQR